MRRVDFEIIEQSARLFEFKRTKDPDIIRYVLMRATGLDYESLNDLIIDYSIVRHKIKFYDKPEMLIRILDDLQRLKLDPLIKSNDELVYDMDVFFSKIN